jgi:Glycosyl transferases group 1
MYPLDRGVWGPISRITHLRDELLRLVDLDLVDGNRGRRRVALARYAASGRLRGLDGVYVESSTFLPAEADIAFLGLARALGVPVITYVRDAYQLFDDYGTGTGLRGRVGRALFRPAIRALRSVSTRLAFPTNGLARAVLGDRASDGLLLPPGAPAPFDVPMAPDAGRLLFVGDARLPAHGADRLIRAVGLARGMGAAVELTVVCRPGTEPPGPWPAWLRIERASGDGVAALLPDVVATVIPRPRNPYNDLALPIKLFDYLAYGRPLLVTDCVEQAAIVREADCGVVTGDSPDDLATGIGGLLTADEATRTRWSANARRAAERHSWGSRAARIVDLLTAHAPDPAS